MLGPRVPARKAVIHELLRVGPMLTTRNGPNSEVDDG
jgi:hypothetical protein